jgi:hypothetical protein
MRMSPLLLWVGLVPTAFAQGYDEAVARDRAKAALVVHATAVQVVEETGRLASPTTDEASAIRDRLARAMLDQPERHRKANDSRRQCRDTLTRIQTERVVGLVSQAVVRAQQQSPLPVTSAQVMAKVGLSESKLAESALAAWTTNGGVESLFVDARNQAVGQQRRDMDAKLRYPDQGPLDAMLLDLCNVAGDPSARMPAESWPRLWDRLDHPEGVSKGRALFEENEKYLQGASSRMADAIRIQPRTGSSRCCIRIWNSGNHEYSELFVSS